MPSLDRTARFRDIGAMNGIPAKDRLIVALDVPSVAEAEAMVGRLGDSVAFYKIGLQLVFAGGIDFAQALAVAGKKVFLDVKLLDIDNTVEGAVANIAAMGMSFVTIHAYPKAMRAAVKARGAAPLKLLGVTVLTSLDEADLAAAGYAGTVAGLVAARAADARAAGMDGIVASPAEAASVRKIIGPGVAIVTPGIRPAGADAGDQKRIATPAAAIAAGADYLVVGRPITAAADPKAAAEAIQAEIAGAI
jgi:orotidine-5'-phosphate decarboxylase